MADSTTPETQEPALSDNANKMLLDLDEIHTAEKLIRKLIYGGAPPAVLRQDITALLAQIERATVRIKKVNNQLAPGEVWAPTWTKSGQ